MTVLTVTRTRTHVFVGFADPYLVCGQCWRPVPQWHNDDRCGCDAGWWNEPCEHRAGVDTLCPSWGPVDGCTCLRSLGYVPHPAVLDPDRSYPKPEPKPL